MAIKSEGPMPEAIRKGCFVVSLIVMLLFAFLVAAPYWRTTSTWGTASVISNIFAFEGLFLSCVHTASSTSTNQCYQLPMFGGYQTGAGGYAMADVGEGVYTYLNAFRAMMIIGLICSVAGVVCSALGMRCTSALEEDGKAKRWIVICGGILHILAGVLTGISVSWYAAEVVREYYSIYYVNQKMKYTLGACLYVGWVSMIFSLVCGFLMTCCTCFSKPVDQKQVYSYSPATATEKYALPPTNNVQAYKPIVSEYVDNHRSDRHRPSSYRHGSSRHNRRRQDDRRSASSYSSHRYRDSSKSSRHDSHDEARASGFV